MFYYNCSYYISYLFVYLRFNHKTIMLRLYVKALSPILIILTITIICVTPETNNRCGLNSVEISGCFEERIEKSRQTIKHTIQLKFSAVPPVNMISI